MNLNSDRANFLGGKIALMASSNDFRDLGTVALETLVLRNTVEEVLEGDYSKKEKQRAEALLKEIRELERKVAQLYAISRIRRERPRTSVPSNIFGRMKVPI